MEEFERSSPSVECNQADNEKRFPRFLRSLRCQLCWGDLDDEFADVPLADRVCPECADRKNPAPSVDRWQFEEPRRSKRFLRRLTREVDGSAATDFQERPPRIQRRTCPTWAASDAFIRKISCSYTKNVGESKRHLAILYLHFRCGWSAKDVARQLGVKAEAVERSLARMTNRADKQWPSYASGITVATNSERMAAGVAGRSPKNSSQPQQPARSPIRARTVTAELIERFVDGDSKAAAAVESCASSIADLVRQEATCGSDAFPERAILPFSADRKNHSIQQIRRQSRRKKQQPIPLPEDSCEEQKQFSQRLAAAIGVSADENAADDAPLEPVEIS